jgi:hypothetical protein
MQSRERNRRRLGVGIFAGGMTGLGIVVGFCHAAPAIKDPGPKLPPSPYVAPFLGLQQLAIVVPFPYGEADSAGRSCRPLSDAEKLEFERSVQNAIAAVKSAQAEKDRALQALVLFASTDRSQLVGACREKFKTNRELAMSRGQAITRYLQSAGIMVPISVIPGGPTELISQRAAEDRSVGIYGLLARPAGDR